MADKPTTPPRTFPTAARNVIVHGRVQGVHFREATRRVAVRHGLTGWVFNHADGNVEAWFEGPADAVEAVTEWVLAGGPSDADIIDVEIRDVAPAGHDHFEVRG